MAGLKQIKGKIRAVKKTGTVTKAMEAVSAAKMRKTQQTALRSRAYARAAAAVLARVSGSRELSAHPLTRSTLLTVEPGRAPRALYMVITADRGLAGGLNSGVLRAVERDAAQLGLVPEAVRIIAVGRKAKDFFAARGYTLEAYHPNTAATSVLMSALVDEAARLFAAGEVDTAKVAYQNFVSTFEQRPTIRTVFPLSLAELSTVVEDITPARGAYASQSAGVGEAPATYSIEPNEEEVLNALLPRLASVFVFHALLESQASEHSARMVAMKSATDKARELSHVLTLSFNKARQAAITREVSEIIAGTL